MGLILYCISRDELQLHDPSGSTAAKNLALCTDPHESRKPAGGIKTWCPNGVANTRRNMLRSGGQIIFRNHRESNLWRSKSEGVLRGPS